MIVQRVLFTGLPASLLCNSRLLKRSDQEAVFVTKQQRSDL